MDNFLQASNLVKNYTTETETLEILKGVSFTINLGESISITGESGSGKSTLLNLLGGLDTVTKGSIIIEGTDITKLDENELAYFRNKKIGFIFQQHLLLEEFNILENVMLPFLINKFNKKDAMDKAKYLLDYVGLTNRINHYPSQLSGGEKQRVAIARAFINSPTIILADEPTGNLDEKNANNVLELLFNITKENKHCFIIVTHSLHISKMTDISYHLENGILHKIN